MKILVPLDGSVLAEAAVGEARRLVQASNGEIILLTVGELPETGAHRDAEQRALRRIVDPVAEQLSDLHVSVRTEMRGDAVEAILRAAADEGVDQIVMSTHGRSGLSRLTHGSVVDSVLRRSPVTVTLVRPGGHTSMRNAPCSEQRPVLRHAALPGHEPALQQLLTSLEHETTVVQSPPLAQRLLRALRWEFPAEQ